MKEYYLDNAATTQPYPEVVEAMLPYYKENYGNASTIYDLGVRSKEALDNARKTIAKTINAEPSEIYFTSGGTESDNWALISTAEAMKCCGNHIITTQIEHHAILETCKYLESRGFEITYLPVDEQGFIDLDDLEDAIKEETILVSIMFANNEIGTIQNIEEIGRIFDNCGIIFHTDAVQAYGKEYIDVKKLHIDLMSVSAHKIHGPKGVGFLYISDSYPAISSFMHGGNQESGKRAGTENIAAIVGFAKAAEITYDNLLQDSSYASFTFNELYTKLKTVIPDIKKNGAGIDNRIVNIINITIPGIRSEQLMMMLNQYNIYISAGSACMTGSGEPSHVLKAIGLTDEEASSSIRISFGHDLTVEDINYIVGKIKFCVNILRGE